MSDDNQRSSSPLPRDVVGLLGPKALAAMKASKWFAYARIIEEALYYGGIDKKKLPLRVETVAPILGVEDGSVVDLQKVMRDLAHECERLALLEATS